MTVRFYSSIAQQTTLTGTYSPSSTVIAVAGTTGFPSSTPFTLSLDYGAPNEELVDVTSVAGLSLTVTRAVDGTSATTHNAGAVVRHVSSARDFAESRAHENASTNVHGIQVGSSVVGTTDVQTLTNKTLTNPTFNNPSITGTVTGNASYSAVTLGGTATALASGAANVPLVAKGAASQTADLQEWQSSTGTVLAKVTSSGNVQTPNGLTAQPTNPLQVPVFIKGPAAMASPYIDIQDSTSVDLVQVDTGGQLLAKKGAVLTGALPTGTGTVEIHAGPSSNSIAEFYESGGSMVASFDNSGQFHDGTLVAADVVANNPNAWTTVTDTGLINWTTTTGVHTPTWGNATMSYTYKIILGVLHFSMFLTFGTTTNFGTGVVGGDNWTFSLTSGGAYTIIPPFSNGTNSTSQIFGWGKATFSSSNVVPLVLKSDASGTACQLDVAGGRPDAVATPGGGGTIDSLTPQTWASGNSLQYWGFVPVTPSF